MQYVASDVSVVVMLVAMDFLSILVVCNRIQYTNLLEHITSIKAGAFEFMLWDTIFFHRINWRQIVMQKLLGKWYVTCCHCMSSCSFWPKETGYCGYGDTCIYLHDRSDYKSGFQWDAQMNTAFTTNFGQPPASQVYSVHVWGQFIHVIFLSGLDAHYCWSCRRGHVSGSECTKIARFSAAAAAIFTAPKKIARSFEAPRCAISSAKKIASEPRFLLRIK